jgi:hypothetical protein
VRFAIVCMVGAIVVTLASQDIVSEAASGKWMDASKADVAALTAMVHQEFGGTIMGVHVVGNYALAVWSQPHICCPSAVYSRPSGEQWKRIAHSAGDSPLGTDWVQANHVPASVGTALCAGWPKGYGPC